MFTCSERITRTEKGNTMSKTLSIDTNASREVRGQGETTVASILKAVEGLHPGKYTPADLLIIGASKVIATTSDRARRSSGKLASRLYSPALDDVDDAAIPPALESAVDVIADVDADLASGRPVKLAGKPRAAKKPAAKKPAAEKPAKDEKPAPKKAAK
jgi:hypothetical protein